MELNAELFQPVIDDLEDRGFIITVLAGEKKGRLWDFESLMDYTILAKHPSGRTWEIIGIQ